MPLNRSLNNNMQSKKYTCAVPNKYNGAIEVRMSKISKQKDNGISATNFSHFEQIGNKAKKFYSIGFGAKIKSKEHRFVSPGQQLTTIKSQASMENFDITRQNIAKSTYFSQLVEVLRKSKFTKDSKKNQNPEKDVD